MTILTLQRRLREIGRIRLGQKTAKNAPTKLETYRFTSADSRVIEAAASLYGGRVNPWQAPAGEQWEVVTDATELEVIIPPGPSVLSQYEEQWTGGGCVRRCDGVTELLTGQPCICLAEDDKQCKTTTRLSVILADMPGLGVWRVETHSYYAATELAGTVDVCQAVAQHGQLLPAILRLEPRQVKRANEPLKKFMVPVLDIHLTPTALGVATSNGNGHQSPVLEQGSWKAIAAAPEPAADVVTVEEMGAAMAHPAKPPATRRSNTPPDIPATGLKPQRATVGSAIPTVDTDRGQPVDNVTELPLSDDPLLSIKQRNMIYALLRGNPNSSELDADQQHRYCANLLGLDELDSINHLTKAQASTLIDELKG